LVALLAALLLVGACTESPDATTGRQSAGAKTPPNILIILTDDQPVDSLGVMPATRRLFRRQGVDFTNAYVTTPYCCPSRASISTGLYTHNHGVRWNMERQPDALGDHSATIEYQLRSNAGYRTAFFGKYLNSWDLEKDPPHLDRWAIFPNSAPHGYYGGEWNIDGRREVVETYSTEFIRRRGVDFIRENAEEPWLMYLSTAAPHPPFTPEPKYEEAPVGGWGSWTSRNPSVKNRHTDDKHPWVRENQKPLSQARRERRQQLRTLMSVDDMVRSVMRTLEETEQQDETLAFFISDNGYLWGEHGLTRKMLPYTRSVKVPLMMRWPEGHVSPGTEDDRLVANIDLAQTIYDAAGLDGTPPTDGRSLLDDTWDRQRLHLEFYADHGRPTWASTLAGDHQYIEWYEDTEGTVVSFREYYDLGSDPHQLHNLAVDSETRDLDIPALSDRLAADRECRGRECP
jgi:arylsulfatase A-like enzyme